MKIGKLSKKHFIKDTINAYKINNDVLKKIIYKNRNTEFGNKHKFSKIDTLEKYKNAVPLSSYCDYEKYIMRMCKGEKNILLSENVEYYGRTSGTTGKQKLIPMTKSGRKVASKYMAILPQRILYENFKQSWSYGKGLVLTDTVVAAYTESGVPISSATAGGMRSIKFVIPLVWTTPLEVMKLKDSDDALYLHLLFALKERNLMYMSGVFISSILDMFRYLEKHWEELVKDIERGRISSRLKIDNSTKNKLLKKLSPDVIRADFLREEFNKGFKGIAKRIWPKLIYIISVTGANFSIYDNLVNEYTDNLPIYSSVYAATEATVGINRHINKQNYILIPTTAFFEFIPCENMYDKKPLTKDISQLENGKEYEIVVTNFSGLYRYRIGDVVKVVDYYNNSPEIQFLYRRNQILNMVAEKTTEEHVLLAIKNTFNKLRCSFLDYTVIPNNSNSPGNYVFFIEIKDKVNKNIVKNISTVLDKELSKANLSYGRHRRMGKLAGVQVKIVKRGTFILLKKMITQKGVAKSQFKVPRVLKEKWVIEFINKRVEL